MPVFGFVNVELEKSGKIENKLDRPGRPKFHRSSTSEFQENENGDKKTKNFA